MNDTNIKRTGTKKSGERRRYDSPLRRAQAAETRSRIVSAGCALAREARQWDWRELTIKAIAKRAGVSERTVYRHFPTERVLHEAMMRQLESDAGVRYEGIALDDMTEAATRIFNSLSSFAVTPQTISDETFVASNQRRRTAVRRAVRELTIDWPDKEQGLAAAALDVLWMPTSYEHLVTNWGLSNTDATRAVTWAIETLIQAIENGNQPSKSTKRETKIRSKSNTGTALKKKHSM